ncbi:amidohydrolase family protein [Flavihumibacter cheonanensis]|uniref:amidohydrolase family protein n=1 Tax=Flavihumibacter cheonanensis TaxID=1442385 RepID=UPI001EF7EC15|nr:amidohydrolase family protein [Flavihumibacter cheonanensis]MCG7753434.1 amidohydrolase family protein [Flavihumibacter cheonanensis]
MAYRKFRGTKLFTGKSWAPQDSVLITQSNGQVEAIVSIAEAGDDIQPVDGIISPGFINAHCHLELSHMAGKIPPQTGMIPFLLNVMNHRQAAIEAIQEASYQTDQQMHLEGIVAVGDICNTLHSLETKKSSRLNYHSFVEVSGFIGATAQNRFEQARTVWEKFREIGPASITPHAPYSVSPELFQLINDFDPGTLLSMHNQESEAENDFFISGQSPLRDLFTSIGVNIDFFQAPGITSLQAVLPHLNKAAKLILVHNVVTSPDDLAFLQQQPINETFFCVCPGANQYINQSMPPGFLLKSQLDKIVIGTDSLASNYQLSITEELKLLAGCYPEIPLEHLLQWATLNGAKALNMDSHLGSFEKGKTPGVIALNDWKVTRLL